jgi:hypothetical protein
MRATESDAARDDRLHRFQDPELHAVVPGKKNPITWWRWTTRGVAGLDGERIKLEVWYIGRTPHTSVHAVKTWLAAVTAARLARMARTASQSGDATDEDLRSVGR